MYVPGDAPVDFEMELLYRTPRSWAPAQFSPAPDILVWAIQHHRGRDYQQRITIVGASGKSLSFTEHVSAAGVREREIGRNPEALAVLGAVKSFSIRITAPTSYSPIEIPVVYTRTQTRRQCYGGDFRILSMEYISPTRIQVKWELTGDYLKSPPTRVTYSSTSPVFSELTAYANHGYAGITEFVRPGIYTDEFPAGGSPYTIFRIDEADYICEEDETNNERALAAPNPSDLIVEAFDARHYVTGGLLPTNASPYAVTTSQPLSGVIADGVSTLLLRVKGLRDVDSAEPLRFTLNDAGRNGWLHPIETGTPGAEVPATLIDGAAGSQTALCLYRAPADFSQLAAPVTVRLMRTATQLTRREIAIRRPPLVLVHGVWSSAEPWIESGALDRFAQVVGPGSQGWPVTAFDYRATAASAFAVNALGLGVFLGDTLEQCRMQGYAASQCDLVAHSMGGLLARMVADHSRQSENYLKGSVHRLITLGTPHRGSYFADFVALNRAFENPFYEMLRLIFFALDKPVDQGAVDNLSQFQGLSGIPGILQLPIPSHAVASSTLNYTGDVKVLYDVLELVGFAPPRRGDADGLVALESQRGGLSVGTSAAGAQHTSEIADEGIQVRVAELLDAPIGPPHFDTSGFARFTGVPLPLGGALAASRESPAKLSGAKFGTLRFEGLTNQQVVIGNTLQEVLLSADEPGPWNAAAVIMGGSFDSEGSAVTPLRIRIPDGRLGPMTVLGVLAEATSRYATGTVTIKVTTTNVLKGVLVEPADLRLRTLDPVQLNVVGFFDDLRRRDISRWEETSFVSSHPAIAQVDEFGRLRILRGGDQTVEVQVRCRGYSARVRVMIELADLPPKALVRLSPSFGASPLSVQFDASASWDPEGDSLVYFWDFGDGGSASGVAAPTHTYTAPGDYTFRLRVEDGTGQIGQHVDVVRVSSSIRLEVAGFTVLPEGAMRVHFQLVGAPQARVETSQNLRDWQPTEVVFRADRREYIDVLQPGGSRFFRAVAD